MSLPEVEFQAHIASKTGKNVYMVRAPTNAEYPYLVQRVITKNNHGYGVTQMRIQLDIYAQDPNGQGEAKTIAVDTHDAIHDAKDDIDAISGSYRVSEMETFNSETKVFQIIMDAMLYYSERAQFD